jgi:serine protease Do
MRLKIVCLLSMLVVSTCCFALSPQEIYKKCAPSIVEIKGFDKVGGAWSGTGVCILPDVILTNRHLTANAFELNVCHGGKKFEIVGFIEHPNHAVDLAIIVLKGSGLHPIEIANSAPAIGFPIYLLGNPYGINYSFTCGTSNGIREEDGCMFFFTTALAGPGMSGGACLNTDGQLVGLHFGKVTIFSVEVPLNYIKEIVDVLTKEAAK